MRQGTRPLLHGPNGSTARCSPTCTRPILVPFTDPREVVQLSKFGAVGGGGGPGGGGGSSRPSSSLQLYRLWPGRELAPGETLEWPLWLHPRGVGTLKLPLVWYGEPVVSTRWQGRHLHWGIAARG